MVCLLVQITFSIANELILLAVERFGVMDVIQEQSRLLSITEFGYCVCFCFIFFFNDKCIKNFVNT